MNMQTDLSLRSDQRLALMPKMLQSIEVLQMATADLVQLIDEELQQNETLELVRVESEAEPGELRGGFDVDAEGFRRRRRMSVDEDRKHAFLHTIAAPGNDLLQHLREQLAWLDVPDRLAAAVLSLAEQLDGSGFLDESDRTLREIVGRELFDEALSVLRSLDPEGLGATGPIDAMLRQLSDTDPDRAAIAAILNDHLDALAKNRIPDVAHALDLTTEEVELLIERIRSLDPCPGEAFRTQLPEPLRPDLIVRRNGDRFEVVVDELALPVLDVDGEYEQLAYSDAVPGDVRRYLRGKLQSARDLIRAVEQRKTTLVRVGAAIMSRQRGFLERGRCGIQPLKMANIADELGLHTSTVSRAIAGKAILTEHGVFVLRDFFDGARRPRHGPNGHGRLAVQEHVRTIFAGEDPARPLSDDDVVEQLGQLGIKVARRTVAKYRKELGIRSSWQRRRFG